MSISPQQVHKTIGKYMITDGFDLVLDLNKSHGCQIYNSKTDEYMLDGFSFFASAPLGTNHPDMTTPEFTKKIGELAVNKPTNSDIYTPEMAEFVDTFGKYAVPNEFKHLFFISGGSLAVENALKTAFDWKIRKNLENGKKQELGNQIIHFKEAFHGRTGYTICMTNTFNQNKIKYFPKFNWPRVINPKITFPLNKENTIKVEKLEQQAIDQINTAIQKNTDDIAGLIIEPIQGEGGDNHFRDEFFQALRKICDDNQIMLIFDEVQSGLGLTGKMWCYQHYDITPDIIAFGKKTQVCGIMVTDRVEEIQENVFNEPSRINSTWGGNIVDMVRCQKYLEIIEKEKLVENAKKQGDKLQKGLIELQEKYDNKIFNTRGRGMMCAFDLFTPEKRDMLQKNLYKNGLIVLGCGEKTIRFRPPLIITSDEINKMLTIIDGTLKTF